MGMGTICFKTVAEGKKSRTAFPVLLCFLLLGCSLFRPKPPSPAHTNSKYFPHQGFLTVFLHYILGVSPGRGNQCFWQFSILSFHVISTICNDIFNGEVWQCLCHFIGIWPVKAVLRAYWSLTLEERVSCALKAHLSFHMPWHFQGREVFRLSIVIFSLLDNCQSLDGGIHPWRLCGLLEISWMPNAVREFLLGLQSGRMGITK